MWPASIGTSYAEWNDKQKAWFFGADGQPFAAVLGSPDATLVEREYGTNYSLGTGNSFSLGTISGRAERTLVFAGSVKSRDEALATYRKLLSNPDAVIASAGTHDRDYLARTVSLTLPDKQLQAAYDWSKLSMMKGMVENPLLGTGLVAGYGPSKGVYRPGFAWFFGRDTFWTSFALTAAGDLESARTAIAFISKYQRADGKIPHEISQSASLVPWFETYPYGYASADATPLFVIAVHNYVQASGDLKFVREQWPKLQKAFDFMRANFESHGFPKNFEVGHGWVEGGPLLPVQVELYQAGCYVEALRAMSVLARVNSDRNLGDKLDQEFRDKKKLLEDLFWLPQGKRYAFALDTSGKPVDQPTVLATVPMWFGVLDQDRSLAMINRLSEEEHETDWGMRIISSRNPLYGPDGYHYGSVWPLFTGWASVAEYRYHAEPSAYANLRANAWLALDGAGGNATEVLSGMTYSPLSTASPHQIWSAAMVVSPLLRGLCGLDVDGLGARVTLAPHLPADWSGIGIEHVNSGHGMLDFTIKRDDQSQQLKILNHGTSPVHVVFSPAYSRANNFWQGTFDGAAVRAVVRRFETDQHPDFDLEVGPGEHTLTIPHQGIFGYSLPYEPPQLGAESVNLKIASEHWASTNKSVEIGVSGRGGRSYRMSMVGAKRVSSITGAKLEAGALMIDVPAGEGYVNKTVTINLY